MTKKAKPLLAGTGKGFCETKQGRINLVDKDSRIALASKSDVDVGVAASILRRISLSAGNIIESRRAAAHSIKPALPVAKPFMECSLQELIATPEDGQDCHANRAIAQIKRSAAMSCTG